MISMMITFPSETAQAKDIIFKQDYISFSMKAAKKEFGYDPEKFFNISIAGIRYKGKLNKNAKYYLDGRKQKNKLIVSGEEDGENSYLSWNKMLESGTHTLTIKKKGFIPFEYTFSFEEPSGIFYGTGENQISFGRADVPLVHLHLNPYLNQKLDSIIITIDGIVIEPYKILDLTGDGDMVVWIDATDLTTGEHEVIVSVEGYGTESRTFYYYNSEL